MLQSFKSICYKKVQITEFEYQEYELICKRYHSGQDIFRDTFEVDDDGRIIFIRSVYDREMSFEVLHFLQNLMVNQWLRYCVSIVENKEKQIDEKIKDFDNKITLLDSKLNI